MANCTDNNICGSGGCGSSNCSGCSPGCGSGCSGKCSGGCYGSCTSCDGCEGCSGCTSCDGCSGSCEGKCNSGCKGEVASQAYNNLILGLQEYITEQDLKDIQLIFEAVKNRRSDANQSTNNFKSLTFTKNTKIITEENIQDLSNNASSIGFGINQTEKDKIVQNKHFYKTTAEELKNQALNAYKQHYPR